MKAKKTTAPTFCPAPAELGNVVIININDINSIIQKLVGIAKDLSQYAMLSEHLSIQVKMKDKEVTKTKVKPTKNK